MIEVFHEKIGSDGCPSMKKIAKAGVRNSGLSFYLFLFTIYSHEACEQVLSRRSGRFSQSSRLEVEVLILVADCEKASGDKS